MPKPKQLRSGRWRPLRRRRFAGLIRGVASSLALLVAAAATADCTDRGASAERTAEDERAVTRSELTAWELDELYGRLLGDSQRLAAVWKQQPANGEALRRYVAELRGQLARLRAAPVAAAAQVPAESARQEPASRGTAQPPAGPVEPSRESASEEAIARRSEATLDRFLSGGPLEGAAARPSLGGVSGERIASACDRAEAELAAMTRLLAAPSPDPAAVERSLERLHEILTAMGSPPAAGGRES